MRAFRAGGARFRIVPATSFRIVPGFELSPQHHLELSPQHHFELSPVSNCCRLSDQQLAAFPKEKLQQLARQAGATDAQIQDASSNDQFFADADGDGQRDERDMHTLEEINKLYTDLDVNTAELLALRLYTGPMFELYNNVLRAKGGKVPFGGSYPGLKGEITTGKFVTTIVSISGSHQTQELMS